MNTIQLQTKGTVTVLPVKECVHAAPDRETLVLECLRLNAEIAKLHQTYTAAVGELLLQQQQTMTLLLDVTQKQ